MDDVDYFYAGHIGIHAVGTTEVALETFLNIIKEGSMIEEVIENSVCPVDCILEGTDQFYIDPDVCIDCGACKAVCLVNAIEEEYDLTPDLQINKGIMVLGGKSFEVIGSINFD